VYAFSGNVKIGGGRARRARFRWIRVPRPQQECERGGVQWRRRATWTSLPIHVDEVAVSVQW